MFYKNEFISYLILKKGLSQNTVNLFTYLVKRLEKFFISQEIKHVKHVSLSVIEKYFASIKKKLDSRVYYQTVSQVIQYFKFLEDKEVFFISPLEDYDRPKYIHTSHPKFTEQEITNILGNIKINDDMCFKGKVILELIYSSALRPREIYNLKISDIDFNEGILFVEQSKNFKDRKVPVGKTALLWIDKYIQEIRRKYLSGQIHEFVFINHKTGKKMTYSSMRYIVQKTLSRSNIERFRLYSLRGTSATVLHQHGMNTLYISKMLGHVELKTTQIYIQSDRNYLKKEITNKHPRNKLNINKGDEKC